MTYLISRRPRRLQRRIASTTLAILASVASVSPTTAQSPAPANTAAAPEIVTTNRATELRANPDDASALLQSLTAQTKVQLLERKGAWSKVKTDTQTGWVRMMHLRGGVIIEEAAPAQKSGGGGFLSSFNRFLGGSPQTNQRAQSATVGIRGLSPEELKTATPNAQALADMKSFASSKPDAEKFAKDAKLAKADVADPLEQPKGGRR
jgi:hypothetical protein